MVKDKEIFTVSDKAPKQKNTNKQAEPAMTMRWGESGDK